MGNTKRVVIIVVVVLVVAAVIAWAIWYSQTPSTAPSVASNASNIPAVAVATSSTRSAVPTDVTVPNEGATTTVAAGVAVPVVQGAGDPAGNVSYRSFNITVQNGAYSPDTVIVNQGDTVNLEVTAVGAAYGFDQPDYGFNVNIPESKTQTIQFQALQPGNFTFYCDSCGGPSKGPVGHIMVVAK